MSVPTRRCAQAYSSTRGAWKTAAREEEIQTFQCAGKLFECCSILFPARRAVLSKPEDRGVSLNGGRSTRRCPRSSARRHCSLLPPPPLRLQAAAERAFELHEELLTVGLNARSLANRASLS